MFKAQWVYEFISKLTGSHNHMRVIFTEKFLIWAFLKNEFILY